jgi:hypothetical protein
VIIAIHQPDFMPWLGFFDKISKADKLVILDHTLNQPGSTAFRCRRVKFLINGKENWLSISLEKPAGISVQAIYDMKITKEDDTAITRRIKTMKQSYSRAPFFEEIFPLVENYFRSSEMTLLIRNMSFILKVMKLLDIKPEVLYSSGLDCSKSSSELMLEITQKTDGTVYLSGDGAYGYIKPEMFNDNGIDLRFNNFIHPVYKQFNTKEFISGLSVVDALMNLGVKGTKEILNISTN